MQQFLSSTECPQRDSREDLPTQLLLKLFNGHQVCRILAISEPTYGSTALVHDHSVARGDKFAPRAKKGTLVGFEGDNIYRVWIHQDHKVIWSSACTPGFAAFGRSMCEVISSKDSG